MGGNGFLDDNFGILEHVLLLVLLPIDRACLLPVVDRFPSLGSNSLDRFVVSVCCCCASSSLVGRLDTVLSFCWVFFLLLLFFHLLLLFLRRLKHLVPQLFGLLVLK